MQYDRALVRSNRAQSVRRFLLFGRRRGEVRRRIALDPRTDPQALEQRVGQLEGVPRDVLLMWDGKHVGQVPARARHVEAETDRYGAVLRRPEA